MICSPIAYFVLGGMHFVDPLFQRTMVNVCRARNIPVVFDEVFSGFYRLGPASARDLLHVDPDIACYAKLLTGGFLPLSVTLASQDVFDAFYHDSTAEALLHGIISQYEYLYMTKFTQTAGLIVVSTNKRSYVERSNTHINQSRKNLSTDIYIMYVARGKRYSTRFDIYIRGCFDREKRKD
jgi:acetylornithine/succinyldiaminopimelate/putrescine aminotransferase